MATVLWIAQVALFAGAWLGPWRDAPAYASNGRLPRTARLLLSLSLVVAAVLMTRVSAAHAGAYTRLVLLGMLASFVGDLVMARVLPLPNRLIGGMAAFGSAHAFYIAAYVQTLHAHAAAVSNLGLWLGLALYGAASVSGWRLFIRNPQRDRMVNVGALVYGAWIGVMAAFALALAAGLGGAWWFAAFGGVLFVVSDFLIGLTEIGGYHLRNANDWIWLTYVAGQMGIIYAPWLVVAR